MRCPLTITVQAPHCPWSQPFFVPVSPDITQRIEQCYPRMEIESVAPSIDGQSRTRGRSLNGASFTAVEQLQEHIDAFIAVYNETAERFVWEDGARRSTWG